jgi:hypothetical protein
MPTEPTPKTRQYLDVYSFKNLPSGEIARRVCPEGGNVNVDTGLDSGGRFTAQSISDASWTALPSGGNLTDRNGISIQNESGVSIYINHSAAAAADTGCLVRDGSERFYTCKNDTVVVYARAATGAGSVTIGVEEIA